MLAGAGLWVVLCIDRGFLQATRAYKDLSLNLLVEGGVRAIAVLGLVIIHPTVLSACVGILIAEIATFAHARVRANASLRVSDDLDVLDENPEEGSTIVRDLVAAVVAMALLAVLQNADVILLGRLQHASSGSYAAISVASKSLYFVAIVLSGYLVPEAAIRWREGAHALRPLAATFAILGVPVIVLFSAAALAPHLLLGLVFSSKYLGAEQAFSTLVLAMACLSVTVVLTLYLLAVGKRWITALLAAGAVALVAATLQTHGNPSDVARANLVVQGLLAALVIVAFVLSHLRNTNRPGA
jgi:O-antigen/teichoic acid export membrane protein